MNVGKHSRQLYLKQGFTIVELLIVVVVIAILATITIVAYNGIKDRAAASALQSSATQAGKKALSYAPLNTDQYPTESNYAADLGVPSSTPQATYDYYTSDDRKAFCISVTDTTKRPETAYSFTQKGQVVQGRCIKNLATNPSFEPLGAMGWSVSNQCAAQTVDTAIFYTGNASYRCTASAANSIVYFSGTGAAITPGQSYTTSAYVRSSQSRSVEAYISAKDATSGNELNRVNSNYTNITANSWSRVSASGTMPANTALMGIQVNFRSAPQNEQAWIDGAMYTAGTVLYAYSDPTTNANWSWVSTPGTSTSFGPSTPSP